MALKKKAEGGVQILSKCEKCGKKVSTLYSGTAGKKICKKCLESEQKETEDAKR